MGSAQVTDVPQDRVKTTARRVILALGLAFALFVFPGLVLGPVGGYLESFWARALVFALAAGVAAIFVRALWQPASWVRAWVYASVMAAAAYRLAVFLPELSTYPLSLGWSEGSRYYYASLFFGRSIYGVPLPPSVLHFTRYLMQAVPFVVPGLPLAAHRIWQVLLWNGGVLVTTWVLSRRIRFPNRFHKGMFMLWAYIFLFQGPVYYHLLVMPIVVLWGMDVRNFRKTLLVVVLVSVWAGLSRINWLPVPGLLAAAVYLIKVRVAGRSLRTYFQAPAGWVLAGTLVGFATQKAYELFSGNPAAYFGSSFTSDLLWYRLLPSATFTLGILPAALIISAPVIMLIVIRLRWQYDHPWRFWGLMAILGVLFAGGVIVSTKIGGGSNLHNLDAFLVLLLVIGALTYFGEFVEEKPKKARWLTPATEFTAIAMLVPAFFTLTVGGQLPQLDFARANDAVAQIQAAVDEKSWEGDVLFISQRHLLAFDLIQDVRLVPDYEKVFLMEMAMGNNRAYLDNFYRDLRDQRFALIVTHPLTINYQGRAHAFGEENDAWDSRVAERVWCYYEVYQDLPEVELQLLAPLAEPKECP